MWQLSKSRGLFFKESGDSPSTCFWVAECARQVQAGAPGFRMAAAVQKWNPSDPASQSNCPDLHDAVRQLVGSIDPRWRSRVNNVYAGRVSRSPDRAYSLVAAKGGMVAIDLEYSVSLAAYVAGYDKYLLMWDQRLQRPASDVDAISAAMREEFEALVARFKSDGIDALRGDWFMNLRSADRQKAHAELVSCGEQYVLAHEVAHQVLRHSSNRREEDAKRLVDDYMNRPAIAIEIDEVGGAQREEIEADVLGLLLMCDQVAHQQGALVPVLRALHGAVFALIASGHLDQTWTAAPGAEHPGTLTRVAVLVKLVNLLFGLEPIPPGASRMEHASIPRTTAVLLAYAAWAEGNDALAGSAVASLQRKRPDLDRGSLTYIHFATVLGLLAEDADRWTTEFSLFDPT